MKIHDSKGKLYYICPFIDKISEILGEKSKLAPEDMFEVMRHLDSIREIAKFLQEGTICGELNYENIYQPYNFSAALKQMKMFAKLGALTEEKIDELTKTYF